jgi:hypothetical protein
LVVIRVGDSKTRGRVGRNLERVKRRGDSSFSLLHESSVSNFLPPVCSSYPQGLDAI